MPPLQAWESSNPTDPQINTRITFLATQDLSHLKFKYGTRLHVSSYCQFLTNINELPQTATKKLPLTAEVWAFKHLYS